MSIRWLLLFIFSTTLQAQTCFWELQTDGSETICRRFAAPEGFQRAPADSGSFAHWLRHLPLLAEGSAVHLYNGQLKDNQQAHSAIIDIDTGRHNLQQCADAVIRLYAEFHYAHTNRRAISFNYTSGDAISFSRWMDGERPVVKGNRVSWKATDRQGDDYPAFRSYLDNIFTYAGSWSLQKALQPVARAIDLQIGDVFIQGGFPGHAVIVVDLVIHPQSGERRFLLAQSFMPAQQIHLLRNLAAVSPWYSLQDGEILKTPEWVFNSSDLYRF